MKVLVNGGINLSELDGWWAEAYTPEVGWALGDAQDHGSDPNWDEIEADALYRLLEQEVVPAFYNRNKDGIPEQWIAKMRHSISTLTPKFSANRAIREYTEEYYIPAAVNYLKRATKKGSAGKNVSSIKHDLSDKWEGIRFGEISVDDVEGGFQYTISIFLNAINPDRVLVQFFANGLDEGLPEIIKMERSTEQREDEDMYHTKVSTTRPASDYTVRIVPYYEGVSVPLEINLIQWQH